MTHFQPIQTCLHEKQLHFAKHNNPLTEQGPSKRPTYKFKNAYTLTSVHTAAFCTRSHLWNKKHTTSSPGDYIKKEG